MKTKKSLIVVLIVIIISLITPITAMAMSPAPQSMTIVVINAPNDLEIIIVHDEYYEGWFRPRVNSRLWETYYQFSLSRASAGIWPYDDMTILINSEKYGEFNMTFPVPRRDFAYKLDLETQTLTQAYSHGRNLIIALCWLAPLFMIDSAVFFLFGHRKKRSWMIFALENLAMQGLFIGVWSLLHIVFSNFFLLLLFLFIPLLLIPIARGVKLAVDIVIFRGKIGEHPKPHATACAVVMTLIGTLAVIILGIILPLPAL